MQKKTSNKARSRAEILAEIAALPPSIQGTISSYKCPRKNGPPAVYHNFQYTLKGKNHSMTIPVGMVTEFKNAIASGKKLRDLVLELSAADTSLLIEQSSAQKKLAHLVLRGAAKIQSVVDAATGQLRGMRRGITSLTLHKNLVAPFELQHKQRVRRI